MAGPQQSNQAGKDDAAKTETAQAATLTQADVDKAVADAVAKVTEAFEEKVAQASGKLRDQIEEAVTVGALEPVQGSTSSSGSGTDGYDPFNGEPTKEYELLASGYHLVLSAPGKPLRVREYVTGDLVPLTDARAAEFIKDRVVVDPDEPESAKVGAQTVAPEGKAKAGA